MEWLIALRADCVATLLANRIKGREASERDETTVRILAVGPT